MNTFARTIKVGNILIGERAPTFIIAEIGINHNGDVATAKKMIDVAHETGADAVKLQTFKAAELVDDPDVTYTYKNQGKEVTESQYEMFKRYELSKDEFAELFSYAKQKGILIFSTPQNISDMELLRELGTPLLKVGSDDLVHLPQMKVYAEQMLPTIISTGMAGVGEIEDAVNIFREVGNDQLAILHCISEYPAAAETLNLRRMETLRKAFGTIVGFSDHSQGAEGATAAVALGAKIIEKHFTLDKNMPGPDHWFSADPAELAALMKGVRFAEAALGTSVIVPTAADLKMRIDARRSMVAARDIAEGETITEDLVAYKRVGVGLAPKLLPQVLGRKTARAIRKSAALSFDDLG